MPHRVLVTGASGTIGRAVTRALVADGHTVVGLDQVKTSQLESLGIEFIEGSTADPETVELAAEGCDTIIHLAAVSDEADFLGMLLDANVKALFNVCHAARSRNARILVASSTRAISGLTGDRSRGGRMVTVDEGTAPEDHCERPPPMLPHPPRAPPRERLFLFQVLVPECLQQP